MFLVRLTFALRSHSFVVGVAQEAVDQGGLGAFALFLHAHEDRGLAQPEPDIDRERSLEMQKSRPLV